MVNLYSKNLLCNHHKVRYLCDDLKKSIYLRRDCRYILFLGNPKGTFGTLLCLQSVVCYTFADGAGVRIFRSPFLSNIFSQTAKLQRDGRLP